MAITVTFDPPLPSDSPSVFNTKAFTLLGDLNDWSTEANSLASTVSSNASTSTTNASNASTSADAAATSASNAAASYDSFDDRYLGSKSSAPTLDNDGAALLTGALYWDSVLSAMFVRTSGGAWTALNASTGIAQAITVNSSSAALTVTQTGAGNAFVVEDSASTDSTPFVIDAAGTVGVGMTPPASAGVSSLFTATDISMSGSSRGILGNLYYQAAWKFVDNGYGWGIKDASGAITFNTAGLNAGGAGAAATLTERMRIDSAGTVKIGAGVSSVRAALNDTSNRGNLQFSDPYDAGRTVSVGNNVYLTASSTWAYSSSVIGGSAITLSAQNGDPGEIAFFTAQDPDVASTVTERMRIDSAGLITARNSTGLGYGAGSGGTVTQASTRTTGVTLNKPSGDVTLVSAAGSATYQSLTVTNSAVEATDSISCSQKSGTDLYEIHTTNVAAGSFRITYRTTGGTTTEQPVFHFNVIKGAAS